MAMTFYQPNLIAFKVPGDENTYQITDESRQPAKITVDNRIVDKTLASGRKKRFYQKIAQTFSITWDSIPFDLNHTIDGHHGFATLIGLVSTQDTVTLIQNFRMEGQEPQTTEMVCFVTDFNYEPVLRRGDRENWRFSVTLGLEQAY